MGNITIKEASKNDIPLILGLLYELGRPKPQKDSEVDSFRKLAKKYITDSDKQILVAVLDDTRIIGMVSMMFLSRLNRDSFEMYIPELVVIKEHQNQGIGKQLIDSCIAIAKKKNCHRIRLESGNQRKESHNFYNHLGFEQNAQSFTLNVC